MVVQDEYLKRYMAQMALRASVYNHYRAYMVQQGCVKQYMAQGAVCAWV